MIAEARRVLEADLATLRRLLDSAPDDARDERQRELDELTDEVHEKLERIERTRRALAAFLPQLQAVVRAR